MHQHNLKCILVVKHKIKYHIICEKKWTHLHMLAQMQNIFDCHLLDLF